MKTRPLNRLLGLPEFPVQFLVRSSANPRGVLPLHKHHPLISGNILVLVIDDRAQPDGGVEGFDFRGSVDDLWYEVCKAAKLDAATWQIEEDGQIVYLKALPQGRIVLR